MFCSGVVIFVAFVLITVVWLLKKYAFIITDMELELDVIKTATV